MNISLKGFVGFVLIILFFSETVFSQEHFPHYNKSGVDEGVRFPKKQYLWVFIMAGQSNMAGRAQVEPIDLYTNERILTIDKNNNWVIAKEPLHFYEPKMVGLDCGMSFAKTLLKKIPDSISIAMIPCAVGGSSVYQWLGDSLHRNVNLYSNFVEKIHLAQEKGVIKGIIWNQGGNDANAENIPNYKHSLEKLFSRFRKEEGDNGMPIIMSELPLFHETEKEYRKFSTKINHIIQEVANEKTDVYLISSQGLRPMEDFLHFNSESQREFGKRFADKYVEIMKNE